MLVLAADVVGATTLRLLEGRAPPNGAWWTAPVSSIAVCLILPLVVDLRITYAYRRLDADARATPIQTLTLIDTLVLAVLVGAWPRFTRAALEAHGAWPTRWG